MPEQIRLDLNDTITIEIIHQITIEEYESRQLTNSAGA